MITALSSQDCNAFEQELNFKYQEGWDILSCGFSENIWWAVLQNNKEYKLHNGLCGEEE